MPKRELIEEILADMGEEALFMDGHDSAIIGLGSQQYKGPVVVYDYAKIIDNLVDMGMEPHEAEEFYSFNIEGAWVGEKTPIIVRTMEDVENA